METKFDLLGKFVPAPCMVKRRNLVRLSAGGGGERKYLMNSEIKLSLGLQISGGGGLGRGEEMIKLNSGWIALHGGGGGDSRRLYREIELK